MPEEAVQKRLDQLVKFAEDIHKDTTDTLIDENKKVRKQNKLLLTILAIMASTLVAVLVMLGFILSNSFDNKTTLDRLDKNQAGIDELVAYLHALPPPNSGTSQVVIDLETLICASSDNLKLQGECNDKGITSQEG